MEKTIQLLPRLSEKTYGLSSKRVFVFNVPRNVNKHMVARAVEIQYEVKVDKVNLTNIPGKAKRTISRNGRRVASGRDNDVRKAYVLLAEGQSLPIFEAVEEEERQTEKVQEELAKKQAENKHKKRTARKPKESKESK